MYQVYTATYRSNHKWNFLIDYQGSADSYAEALQLARQVSKVSCNATGYTYIKYLQSGKVICRMFASGIINPKFPW